MSEAEDIISRKRQARMIAERPGDFKVCVGCDGVIAMRCNICPHCHSYRYEKDAEFVADHAMKIASHPQESVTKEDLIEG